MAQFDRRDLQTLLAPQPPPCVSVFLPAPEPGLLGGPHAVRLKNLLRKAEELLAGAPDRDALLEPIAALAWADSWPNPAEGRALFRSAVFFAQHRLRGPLPERVVVADSFHVRPLLRFLQEDHRYYVLALSLNRVELHEGTPWALEPVDLPGLPGSLSETVPESKEGPAFLNLRTAGGRAIFHGHGSPELTRKGELPRFFRAVDRALWSRLRGERAPLLLAGVAAHWPVYRAISRYPHVAAEGIEGNPSDLGATGLRERAAPIVRELFRAREERVLQDCSCSPGASRSGGSSTPRAAASAGPTSRSRGRTTCSTTWPRSS
jgi:hypothetical protein